MIVVLLILIPSLAWGQSYACPHEVAVSVEPHVATVHEVAGCSSSIAAPNWTQDARWRGIWHFDESDCVSGWADSSPRGNPMTPTASNCTAEATIVQQGTHSYDNASVSAQRQCESADSCTAADFAFTSGDFTAFCWLRRDQAVDGTKDWTLGTDDGAGTIGNGGWRMGVRASGTVYIFSVDTDTTETEIASSATSDLDTWSHQAVRYTDSGNLMEQVINGTLEGTTGSSASPAAGDGIFTIGVSAASLALRALHDDCAVFAGVLSDTDLRYLAVCHTNGTGCRCDAKAPTDYASRPLHVSEGGPIVGTMPACNKAGPT